MASGTFGGAGRRPGALPCSVALVLGRGGPGRSRSRSRSRNAQTKKAPQEKHIYIYIYILTLFIGIYTGSSNKKTSPTWKNRYESISSCWALSRPHAPRNGGKTGRAVSAALCLGAIECDALSRLRSLNPSHTLGHLRPYFLRLIKRSIKQTARNRHPSINQTRRRNLILKN